MSSIARRRVPYYFVPEPSLYPFLMMLGVFIGMTGAYFWMNEVPGGKWIFWSGVAWWLAVMFVWFRRSIGESMDGQYGQRVDISFRWSMSWFIYSEVMFFGAFFTALWYARIQAVPSLGGLENALLWPDFKAVWPSVAAGATASPAGTIDAFETVGPFWLPTINTTLLLTSGVTMTIAHYALQAGKRSRTVIFMWITLLLGWAFLYSQALEYHHAYTELNFKMSSGIYGSTFYLLTGFHGFHVFVGTLMIFFITIRLMKGHFTAKDHFGFEGMAWYWHFVDVVWLFLYILVYWT